MTYLGGLMLSNQALPSNSGLVPLRLIGTMSGPKPRNKLDVIPRVTSAKGEGNGKHTKKTRDHT